MRKIISTYFYLLIILSFSLYINDSPSQPVENITEPKEFKKFMNNVSTALKNVDAGAFCNYF